MLNTPVAAQPYIQATSDSKVGDTVTNPETQTNTKVSYVVEDPVDKKVFQVTTEDGYVHLTRLSPNDTIPSSDEANPGRYRVESVLRDPVTNLVTAVYVRPVIEETGGGEGGSGDEGGSGGEGEEEEEEPPPPPPPIEVRVARNLSAEFGAADAEKDKLVEQGVVPVAPPAAAQGTPVSEIYVGGGGAAGRNAYGVRINFGLFSIMVGRSGRPGDPGDVGLLASKTVTVAHGLITTGTRFDAEGVEVPGRPGILLASVGGPGGKGGDSWGNVDAYRGGAGGTGGSVSLNNATTINTAGLDAYGIYTYSTSGNGGPGGTRHIAAGGGAGGFGTEGGPVAVTNSGIIDTTGKGAHGIYVLSTGGAAGTGGNSWGLVGEGGSGGNGGKGGTVDVNNSGHVHTTGAGAYGILAQSIGGSGGNGGAAGALFTSLGGSGKEGGGSSKVTVVNTGEVITQGLYSIGIVGQSIGGGGGVGGAARSFSSLGGGGGDGGEVELTNRGTIATEERFAYGMLGQSIGGGGGTGGAADGAFAVGGGEGGNGGIASAVTLTQAGVVRTEGSDAVGLLAESVGGGGGSGGVASAVSLFGGLTVGGSGGSGGNGGKVTVTLEDQVTSGGKVRSEIQTKGDRATGILAQSVGGGGGNGGASTQATVGAFGAVSTAVGGTGGTGGFGGEVSLTGTGDILTKGRSATGVILQSVGGGGGNGGMSFSAALAAGIAGGSVGISVGGTGGEGGKGGTVTADFTAGTRTAEDNTAGIYTDGEASPGFIAQSVGGGGGNGGASIAVAASASAIAGGSVSVGVGGKGGIAAEGGAVDVVLHGSVTTTKAQSDAVLVQSVGGGGGNGGMAVSASGSAGGAVGASVSVGIGGDGAGGGAGNTVDARIAGAQIETQGDGSDGVIVQSVGGGGGSGGLSITAGVSGGGIAGGGVSVGLGGKGSGGGSGNVATATFDGCILTTGDQSTGLLVQSVGGGGGNGGGAISATLAGGGVGSGSVAVGLGGSAGAAGHGGVAEIQQADGRDVVVPSVMLNAGGTITTKGKNSGAVVAQSVGGGGGTGGYSIAAAGSGSGVGGGSVGVSIGGTGGLGGVGRRVEADLTADIITEGENSIGVLVQSVGGGGGNGGYSVAGTAAFAGVGSGAVSVALGGSGAKGGAGGSVRAESSGKISTAKDNSAGFVAQSVGGGGGNGGFSVSASIAAAGTGSGAVSVGLGGSAGYGSSGGTVEAKTQTGTISTQGANSIGVLAQSVGGGGGNGGFNVSLALAAGGTGAGAVSVGLGGSGGTGGVGSAVNLRVENDVETSGDNSAAVVAQSVGGGGGNGGFNVSSALAAAGTGAGAVGVGIGGSGGEGGTGGNVESFVNGGIRTGGVTAITEGGSPTTTQTGNNAIGVLVQSVGGGGGNGGMNVTGVIAAAGTGAGGVGVGIGGSAGSGGSADAVKSTVYGTVDTLRKGAAGVVVQSVGGGGGNGGIAITGAVAAAGKGAGSVAVGVGGSGGAGGYSGSVTSVVGADISTKGEQAIGVLAQSVGGGGGNGGLSISGTVSLSGEMGGAVSVAVGGAGGSGGQAGTVDNRVTGEIFTLGNEAAGVVTQSIGGGGGNGGISLAAGLNLSQKSGAAVSVGIGGSGGEAASGETAYGEVNGYVQTEGKSAIGVLTQSVGGGGGNGGMAITGALTATLENAAAVAVGVGGTGGGGGDGRKVTSRVTGGVFTQADNSVGILTQSVGGGGGGGGMSIAGAVTLSKGKAGAVGVGIGGFGGTGGNSGEVDAKVVTTKEHSIIETQGDGASAVVAQSLGGGGGNGGLSITGAVKLSGDSGAAIGVGIGGFGGDGGDADKVKLDVTGNVLTSGEDSHGLLAQSVGGGGGNGGTSIVGSMSLNKKGTGVSAAIGVGGFGGGAGNAGDVEVDFTGKLSVSKGSIGILAQSVGGGGGNGGLNVSGGLSYTSEEKGGGHGLVVGVGGFGGDGGNAGGVDVAVNGDRIITGEGFIVPDILASGEETVGIFAQSVGGGGGNGGVNVSGSMVTDGSVVLGVGGWGGAAGEGRAVNVVANANVVVEGKRSSAIVAQSLGGGGGNGGLNVSGTIGLTQDDDTPSVTFGIGGGGGDGSTSGTVLVTQSGTIMAEGDWSHGILAQSIGGGGGNGALNVSGTITPPDDDGSATGGVTDGSEKKPEAKKTDISVVLGIGGMGGKGVAASTSTVVSSGNIFVNGEQARGILAQSIGGGGGTGGMNVSGTMQKGGSPIVVGVGGFGANGGDAAAVSVTRKSTESAEVGGIRTDGVGAIGIEATSIGGGGGDGGTNLMLGISADLDVEGPTKTADGAAADAGKPEEETGSEDFAVQLAIGGGGGAAGSGAAVTVTNGGGIATLQKYSHGILAQSIGGGGGNAAANIACNVGDPEGVSVNISIGGGAGEGGIGKDVTVTHTGRVTTAGADSYGILAQSIGGGGGNAAEDVAQTFDPSDLPVVGDITGEKDDDDDSGGSSTDIKIGRKGGEGGAGGTVSVVSGGVIATIGEGSYGLLAQSIGNGGGNSSSHAVTTNLLEDLGRGDDEGAKEDDEKLGVGELDIEVGIEGGLGGKADQVTVEASGTINTRGDRAHAIFAQSVGGGGGNAGGVGDAETFKSDCAILLGASGGKGGLGGAIDVTTGAMIETKGDNAIGVLAQSIGGGGGTGSDVMAGGYQSEGGQFLIGVGGDGGEGVNAGAVTVTNNGTILTGGRGAHGVLAQSIGGGGGNAGAVTHVLVNLNKEGGNTEIAMLIGGDGGKGSAGARVDVMNSGSILTTGVDAIGVLAQSIGGGGGNADRVVSGSISTKGASNKISMSLGGSGGEGGTAGEVVVTNKLVDAKTSYIATEGAGAHGIFAMSVGGGGGKGSTVITATGSLWAGNEATSHSVAFGLGGDGGKGGTGGDVTVTNEALIATDGEAAHGILAQSVGGGGGSGGMALSGNVILGGALEDNQEIAIAVGGTGGEGNKAGNVTVTNSGTIAAYGKASYGIFAQSVGGGGGNGGFAAAASSGMLKDLGTNPMPLFTNIGIGGSKGSGADSGDVMVNHTGEIYVEGDNGYGIFAQSVGGGGGTVGSSVSTPVWMAADLIMDLALGMKSEQASTGTAGTVKLNTTGSIITTGKNSRPYLAQSVNGGGGNLQVFMDVSKSASELEAGTPTTPTAEDALARVSGTLTLGSRAAAGSIGSAIEATHAGDIYSAGANSWGSSIQSIGGGGGNGEVEVVVNDRSSAGLALSLGGSGSSDVGGGRVDFSREGDITTTGDRSVGSAVQSIGGGGGVLSLGVEKVETANVSATRGTAALARQALASGLESLAPSAASESAQATTLTMGAAGSTQSSGGAVDLALTGDHVTQGERSTALLVQSIGAGGGVSYITGTETAEVVLGAIGGAVGHGGSIQLENTGIIQTEGSLSHGVLLQSIGGGGGAVFSDLDPAALRVSLSADNSGDGGGISFVQHGHVLVTGDRSVGLLAQSLGGGGGLVDDVVAGSAGGAGRGGAIALTVDGQIGATGSKGIAVFVQSLGALGRGDITVNMAEGSCAIGGAGGAGIRVEGGAQNRITARGLVGTADGLDGVAVYATSGDDSLESYGTLLGTIDLGGGSNRFTSRSGAVLIPGATVNLGAARNLLVNEGVIAPGGPQTVQAVALSGSFAQSATGLSDMELDYGSREVDRIDATGSIQLAGRVRVSILNPQLVTTGTSTQAMFTGTSGVSTSAAELDAPQTVVMQHRLTAPNAQTVGLESTVDFAPGAYGPNLHEIGDYINWIQNVGSSPQLAPTVLRLLDERNETVYRTLLTQLAPDFYGEHQVGVLRGMQRFNETLAARVAVNADSRDSRKGVAWMQHEVEDATHRAHGDFQETEQSASRTSCGLQHSNDSLVAAIGISLENTKSSGYHGLWSSSGETQEVGVSLREEFGGTMAAFSLGYGWNQTKAHRRLNVTEPHVAAADRYMTTAGLLVQAMRDFGFEATPHSRVVVTPSIDLGLAQLSTKSAHEEGSGAQSLRLPGNRETHGWVTTHARGTFETTLASGVSIREYADIAWQHYLKGSKTHVRARFDGAPEGFAGFMDVPIGLGQDMFHAEVGVEMASSAGLSVRIGLRTSRSSNLRVDSANLKIAMPF